MPIGSTVRKVDPFSWATAAEATIRLRTDAAQILRVETAMRAPRRGPKTGHVDPTRRRVGVQVAPGRSAGRAAWAGWHDRTRRAGCSGPAGEIGRARAGRGG